MIRRHNDFLVFERYAIVELFPGEGVGPEVRLFRLDNNRLVLDWWQLRRAIDDTSLAYYGQITAPAASIHCEV